MPNPSKNIVFIDNAEEFWLNDVNMYAKSVDYIRVPTAKKDTRKTYTNNLAKNGNKYAMSLIKTGSGNYVNKGIDLDIANSLKKWALKPSPNVSKYALFDWDGTIASTEGFSLQVFDDMLNSESDPVETEMNFIIRLGIAQYTYGGEKQTRSKHPKLLKKRKTRGRKRHTNYSSALQNIIYSPEYNKYLNRPLNIPSKEFLDDMFTYVMRQERIDMLRDLFRTLFQNGVKIHIVTQNPYASITNPFRQIFIEMMWRLFNEDDREENYSQHTDENGESVTVYQSTSQFVSLISRDELDEMLHSTIDYTNPGELFLKRNILRGLGLG
jgi:phosphoglycolate phosphatase-like HAD superfamily hydrolase